MFENHHFLYPPFFGDSQHKIIYFFDNQTSCTDKTPGFPERICCWNTLYFLLHMQGPVPWTYGWESLHQIVPANQSCQGFKERAWSFLFQKESTIRVDLWAANWVTIHSLTVLSWVGQSPSSFPVATSCHTEKTQAILGSGQCPSTGLLWNAVRSFLGGMEVWGRPQQAAPSFYMAGRAHVTSRSAPGEAGCDLPVNGDWMGPLAGGEGAWGWESLLRILMKGAGKDCGDHKCPCIIYHHYCLAQAASFHWLLTFKRAGKVAKVNSQIPLRECEWVCGICSVWSQSFSFVSSEWYWRESDSILSWTQVPSRT